MRRLHGRDDAHRDLPDQAARAAEVLAAGSWQAPTRPRDTAKVFHHLDAALRSVLLGALPEGSEVCFDAPTSSWAARERPAPTVNAFLRLVRHEPSTRLGGWIERRDGAGRLIAREQAPREFRSCYLVTAWDTDTAREHALLGAVLMALAAREAIPARHLPEPLAAAGLPVALAVAEPALPCAPTDIWSVLGTPPRSALDVVVTAAFVPEVDADLAGPPRRVELGVTADVPAPEAGPARSAAPEGVVRERSPRPDLRGRATRTGA